MIDTNKLIPKRKEGGRSIKTIGNIELIKKDVVKIDSLLKERLVLSKVRYGILRNKNERDKRINREGILERKKSRPQDYDVNLKSNKRGRGLGGFLGGILKALLAGIGFTIFKSLPALLRIGKVIKNLITPFTIGASILIGAIASIASVGAKILPDVKNKNFEGASAKSINQGIENFKSALINTAIAFAVGSAAGLGVSRLVRGRTFTEKQAANILETQKRELRTGKTPRAKTFNRKIRSASQLRLLVDDNFSLNPKPKTLNELAEVEVATERTARLPKGMTPQQYERVYGDLSLDEMGEGGTLRSQQTVKTTSSRTRQDTTLKSSEKALTIQDATDKPRVSLDPYEVAMQPRMVKIARDARRMFPDFTDDEIIQIVRNTRQSSVDMKKLFSESQLEGLDKEYYDRFKKAQRDIDRLRRRDANRQTIKQRMSDAFEGLRKSGQTKRGVVTAGKMNLAERLGQKAANEQRVTAKAAAKEAKEKATKLAGKKGLSKLLFRVGGEAFEQSVQQTIKASVGVIPIIGDLIGFLLDVFLFGQPVGRAAFMATGSLLGGLIGGVFGLIGGPPGAFIGSILGGIGGDLLGGAFYDLLFEGGVGARITDNLTDAFVKKGVKKGIGMGFMSGGFAPYGGRVHAGEFVFNEGTTGDLEKKYPGLLTALNNSRGSQVDQVLETYMSYGNESEGSERLIPLPFEKVVTRTVLVENDSEDTSSSPFMDLYRRG